MYSKELEEIIDAAIADGTLTDVERRVLHKRGEAEGVDSDELDVVIEGRLAKMKRQEDWLRPTPPANTHTDEKLGNVLKCPSCGAQVVGGLAVCPECGYTFSNVKVNMYSEKLYNTVREYDKKIEQIKERNNNRSALSNAFHDDGIADLKNGKMNAIRNFPLPNTRADLLEFLTSLQSKINATDENSDGTPGEGQAYWALYSNCIHKAKISFANDKDFLHYFQKYDEELNKTKGFIGWCRCHKTAVLIISYILFCFILCLILLVHEE